MALIDRIFRDQADRLLRRGNHKMVAAFWLWARGNASRAQVVAVMQYDTTDDAQLDELKATYEALPTVVEKDRFFSDLTAWTILAEGGNVTKQQFRTKFGLT